jgi:hypothetical protein
MIYIWRKLTYWLNSDSPYSYRISFPCSSYLESRTSSRLSRERCLELNLDYQ